MKIVTIYNNITQKVFKGIKHSAPVHWNHPPFLNNELILSGDSELIGNKHDK